MLKVLHIEDDPRCAAYVESLISEKVELVTASTLTQARDWIDHQEFDVLLIDQNICDSTGTSCCMASCWPYFMPIVVISEEGPTNSIKRAEELGVQGYISKDNLGKVDLLSHIKMAAEAHKERSTILKSLDNDMIEKVKPYIACAAILAPIVTASL